MESFDPSLKFLLHRAPASSIQLASGSTNVRVLEPIPMVLPSRGRDVDGAYPIALGGGAAQGAEARDEDKRVAQVELHRRHPSLEDTQRFGLYFVKGKANAVLDLNLEWTIPPAS